MTAAGTWPFPSGRALHGWWTNLAPRRPTRLWFTHLLLHRIEALAEVTHTHHPDAMQLALLRLLAVADGSALAALDHLHVDRQLLGRWLSGLATDGLLQTSGSGWQLTAAGRTAATTGAYTQPGQERRSFYFVDQREFQRPAHFLNLARPAMPQPTPGGDFWFDLRWLQECFQRPQEWKAVHQFPPDVGAVVGLAAPSPAWREVVLDRPEQLAAAVIQTETGVEGYAVQTEDWKLRGDEPAFTLGEGWEAVLPELAAEPSADQWRSAWQGWCRQRSLPAAETEGCVLERRDYVLEVQAPKRLVERLKMGRSDVLQGETWLLAGTGRTRTAACVKVVEGDS